MRKKIGFEFLRTLMVAIPVFVSFCSRAQPTFPCDSASRLYFFQDTLTNGSLSYISGYTTGSPKVTFVFEMPTPEHNALGANPKDGYLYYINNVNDSLMRLDASGKAKSVCYLGIVGNNGVYGCFDPWGRYWTVTSTNQLVAIDINSGNTLKGPYAVSINTWADIVFNPYDCYLYCGSIRCDTNGTVDASYHGINFNPSGNYYGAVAIGTDGNIYGIAGTGTPSSPAIGNLSEINLTTNTSSDVFSFNGPYSGQSDMASFICFNLAAAFKNTPASLCTAPFNVSFADQSSGKVISWAWDFGDPSSGIQNTSTLQNPVHTYNQAGSYSVNLVVSGGASKICYILKDSVKLTVNLGISITSTQTNPVCKKDDNGTATVTATTGSAPYTYNWSSPGGTSNTLSNLAPGIYTVTVSDSKACQGIATITITAQSAVSAGFSTNPSPTALVNDTVHFTDQSVGPTKWSWNFQDPSSLQKDSSALQNPVHVFDKPGYYCVLLTVSNGTCMDTVSHCLRVTSKDSIFVPNVFSPNGDGKNDQFYFTTTGIETLNYSIYDRWGLLLFDGSINTRWDGRTKSGASVPDGTYYYIYKAQSYDGKSYKGSGFVELIRSNK